MLAASWIENVTYIGPSGVEQRAGTEAVKRREAKSS